MLRQSRIFLAFLALALGGCWDQTLLKDVNLVQGVGIDTASDRQFELTIALQKSEKQKKAPILREKGNTIREASRRINRRVSGPVETSSNRLVLIHQETAKESAYAPLDVFYRDPHNPLTSRIAITEESANETLNAKINDEPIVGQHIYRVLIAGERQAVIPRMTTQTFFSKIHSATEDAYIPLIALNREKSPYINGVALLHDTRMTGTLDVKHAQMLIFLSGKTGNKASMTVRVPSLSRSREPAFVSFNVTKVKSVLSVSPHPLRAKATLVMDVTLSEASDNLQPVSERIPAMNEELSRSMTLLADETLKRIQEANCDALGIGLHLKAFHHAAWKRLEWSRDYPELALSSSVTVRVTGHGIVE